MSDNQSDSRKTVAFLTLGCKANRYDSSAMMAMVPADTFRVIDELVVGRGPVIADVYIINTCAVTHKSAFQSRQMVRRVKKWNPEAKIVAAGCLGKVESDKLVEAGADLTAGPLERDKVIEFLGGAVPDKQKIFYHPAGGVQHRGRAVVKIQDGCDFNCSYCIVNKVRGKSQSLPIEEVITQLQSLFDKGFLEAVLTGIHIGLFGRDRGDSLAALLKAIDNSENVPHRIRLSSIDPHELNGELLDVISGSKRICPHLHVPLQSGDKNVLKRMRRPYTPEEAADHINEAAKNIPNLALGLDVIAGFPGETEEEHKNTVEMISSLPVTYLHVFPFSKRPGTDAFKLKEQIAPQVIKERAKELRLLGIQKKEEYFAAQKGRVLEVLAETEKGKMITGTSDNYISVRFDGSSELINKLVLVKTDMVSDGLLVGHLVDEKDEKRGLILNNTEERLGYEFKNKSLLCEALTHSSYANEQYQQNENDDVKDISKNYERLEFLGDAALDLVISDILMRKFPEADEGGLSRIRAGLVNRDSLGKMAQQLSLGDDINLGRGEESCKGRNKMSILAAVFEAVIGAIYLDGSYEDTFSFVEGLFKPLIDSILLDDVMGDYKTPLQERVQGKYKTTPVYKVVGEDGPDHIKIFEVEVKINGKVCASGKGKSKKEAEQVAAKVALKSEFGDLKEQE